MGRFGNPLSLLGVKYVFLDIITLYTRHEMLSRDVIKFPYSSAIISILGMFS